MPWILEHYPAREEWTKKFATEAEAVAELRSHICESCMTGCFGCADPKECDGFCDRDSPPDPQSASDLLSTPCGCEYGLRQGDGHAD